MAGNQTTTWLAMRFEQFAIRFFQELGFAVDGLPDYGPDLIVSLRQGRKYVVELKLYRSSNVPAAVIARAAGQARAGAARFKDAGALIFVTANISRTLRRALEREFNVIAIGYGEIRATLRDMPADLISEFDSITGDAQIFITEQGQNRSQYQDVRDLLDVRLATNLEAVAEPDVTIGVVTSAGETRANWLEETPCGREHSKLYEERCGEALKLMFQDDLRGWLPQNQTNSGMHRFDLIARILSKDDFWTALTTDFRTRYVIFEFKNYCEPIGQGQIYTTEKYLYPAAMRGTAIIVSPRGADDNAKEACRGALRETGKLILTATTAEVCTALRGMDKGENPSDWLAEKLYEELRSLDR